MRHATLFVLAAVVGLAAPAAAQCTGTAGTDFQQVTIREINQIPQANIDALEAAGAALTVDQIQTLLTSDLEGERVEFTAVLLTDPFKSGLRSLNAQGIPGGIHTFVRDVSAATLGVEGMGTQVVDGTGSGLIQQFFAGDEITFCGEVTVFEGNGGVATQIDVETATGTGNAYAASDPLRQPVVVTTDDVHDAFDVGGDTQSQIDWASYPTYNGQYVRFEEVELLQGVPGDRPDLLLSTVGQDTEISTFDTSICFRNNRGDDYFPNGNRPECDVEDGDPDGEFVPPPAGIVNIQGFLSYQGDDGGFDYSVPDVAGYSLVPFDGGDFEIAVAPPIVTVAEFDAVATSDDFTVEVTAIPGTPGNAVDSVVLDVETTSGQTFTVDLTPSAGDVFTGTVTGLTAGDFASFTITATDDQGATSVTGPISRRVVDGPVSSIFDVQATPDGGPGASGVTTSAPVAFDLDATVQSVFSSGSDFFATLQDDPSLAPFTGVFVNFGEADPGLTVGDQVNVSSARVVEAFGVTQLTDVAFTTTGSGTPYDYKEVTTDLFNGPDGAETAEQHEGILLTFPNVTVVATNADDPAGPFGEFLFSSDGTEDNAVRADDLSNDLTYENNDPSALVSEGETRAFVRGPLYFSFGNYKVVPTGLDDIGGLVVSVGPGPGQARVEIESAFPNPTTGTVRVRFALAAPGRQVATLAQGEFSASTHEVTGSLEGLATGVYVLRLEAGGEVVTSRVAVVR